MSEREDLLYTLLTGTLSRLSDESIDSTRVPPDPLANFVERLEFDACLSPDGQAELAKAHDPAWSEVIGGDAPLHKRAEAVHADGTELEKVGSATWRYVYKDNAIVEMSVEDPQLPDGEMHFDADGNEKAA